ncbi:MAG: proline racemase family protein [Tissierellia bacterium]|nr:proline racemase family protein [Tissierellia bacterium]
MDFFKSIQTVDTHTVGQSTRIVLAGVPTLRGNSIMEKKNYLAKHYDYIRSCIMLEPRGHADMFGAFIIEPVHLDADFGMIFMDGKGYLNMCGHGTIGVATVLVDMGMVNVTEPYTELVLESAVGLIKARVLVENRRIKNVSFINTPSFLFQRDVVLDVPGLGTLKFDIAFGGNFFIIIKDSELGVEISPNNTPDITHKALKLLNYAMEHVPVKHPLLPINKIELVEIYGKPKNKDANCQNIVVFGDGQVDRSPCGTGTCAKMAVLYAKGELEIGKDFVHESILETKFTGRILNKTKVGNFEAIIPQITGSAYITGFNNLVINQDDPLKVGFRLSK